MILRRLVDPLPLVDEWTVLSDGTIAIVRGKTYSVDLYAGGALRSVRVPFDWRRLSEEDKVAFRDSAMAAFQSAAAASPSPQGGPLVSFGGGAPRASGIQGPTEFIPAQELPDYQPPFFVGAVRADASGGFWVQTIPTRRPAGGPIYDRIDNQGALTHRVEVPQGMSIVGFGAGGVVYLRSDTPAGAQLHKALFRPLSR
jgi:hypothetical protein